MGGVRWKAKGGGKGCMMLYRVTGVRSIGYQYSGRSTKYGGYEIDIIWILYSVQSRVGFRYKKKRQSTDNVIVLRSYSPLCRSV